MTLLKAIQSKVVIFAVFLALNGCATFYYGYSKEQWDSMSPDEQELAKAEYADVIAEHNKNTFQDSQDKATEAFKDRTKRKKGVAGPDPI